MAQGQVRSPFGLVDKRRGRVLVGANPHSNSASMSTISDMRARLITINGSYFNTDRLNAMTMNDMIYALRDAGSI